MKKKHIPLLFLLLIPGIYFFLFMNKPVARICDTSIYKEDIDTQSDIVMLLDNIDQHAPENALFDILRHRIFMQLCKQYSIDTSYERLREHENMLLERMNGREIINELRNMLGKGFVKRFLMPEYCNYAFVNFALSDTVDLQSDRYKFAKNIAIHWNNDEYKDLLNDFCEYVEYSGNIVIDSNAVLLRNNNNILFEDISYFYVLRQNNEMTYGIRVFKHSIEEIIMSIPADYQIEFYNAGYMRGVYKISEGSYWHRLIFNE